MYDRPNTLHIHIVKGIVSMNGNCMRLREKAIEKLRERDICVKRREKVLEKPREKTIYVYCDVTNVAT